MIKIAIVEDEYLAARELAKMLNQVRPGQIEIKAILENVNQAIEYFSNHSLDLIFMDIHLGDGNSFGIFEKVNLNTPIIFTTAYDQYALQAFNQFSIDYLLKPIDEEDLEKALLKYEKMFGSETDKNYQDLYNNISNLIAQQNYQERFLVNTGDKIKSLMIDEVAYFMAEGKVLYLIGTNGQRYIIEGSLSALEKQLNPKLFYRINRKFIISYQSIKEMFHYSKSRIKLNLNPACPEMIDAIVSQDRSIDFKKWLNQ